MKYSIDYGEWFYQPVFPMSPGNIEIEDAVLHFAYNGDSKETSCFTLRLSWDPSIKSTAVNFWCEGPDDVMAAMAHFGMKIRVVDGHLVFGDEGVTILFCGCVGQMADKIRRHQTRVKMLR